MCTTDIPLAQIPLYPYQPPVAPKRVALDQYGRIYIVGADNKIYWQYGNRFQQYDWQPPLSCIDKLVVIQGASPKDQTMLVKGCDSATTTIWGYKGGWNIVGYNARDISNTFSETTNSFSYLAENGSLSTANIISPGQLNWGTLGGMDYYWTYQGSHNGSVPASKIGGTVFFLNSLSTCRADNFSLPAGQFGQVYVPRRIMRGAEAGCDYLVLPTGRDDYTRSGQFIQKLVDCEYNCPGGGVLWVVTNTTRVFALAN